MIITALIMGGLVLMTATITAGIVIGERDSHKAALEKLTLEQMHVMDRLAIGTGAK